MEKKYSGYYCINCNSIPLIQIIPQKNNIKVLSSCKCHKQYENIDLFIKNKYKKDIIDINKISKISVIKEYNYNNNLKKEEKIDINSVIERFNKIKERMNKEGMEIKNELIDVFKKKIDEVNNIYKKYIINNNKIILIIEHLIKSFQLIKDNPSNISNILNNCKFNDKGRVRPIIKNNYENIDSLFKQVDNYFKSDYIISNTIISESLESKYFFYNSYSVKNFLELDNNLCASCSNNQSNIIIYNLNELEKEKIMFKAHLKNVNWILKSNKNNLISCGDDGLIKIWPIITENFLSEGKKYYSLNENIDNIKKYNIKKVTNINLNSLYEYKSGNKDFTNIEKMIHLRENKFIAVSKRTIFLFKYTIDGNNINIEFIKSYEINNIVDIFVIQKDKDEIIALYTLYNLLFLNIPNLDVIFKINNIRMVNKNNIIQINSKEILIYEGNYLKIIEINNFKTKLIIKSNNTSDFLMNMGDGTIIYSSYYGIHRFLLKTMEELPILIQLNNDDDEYYNDYYYNYDSYVEKIVYLYKLKDGRIITCYQNGKIEICNLKFI